MVVILLGAGEPQLLIAYCVEVQMVEPLYLEMDSALAVGL